MYKTVVQPAVVYGSETWPMTDGYEKTEYMREENIKDTWTSGRTCNMESNN
jgi:hypothetical protein